MQVCPQAEGREETHVHIRHARWGTEQERAHGGQGQVCALRCVGMLGRSVWKLKLIEERELFCLHVLFPEGESIWKV